MARKAKTIETILRRAIARMARGIVPAHCGTAATDPDDVQWAPGYADPGNDPAPGGVLLANWNGWPSDIDRELESIGVSIEWSDEWDTCDDCAKIVRTSPDSHFWRPLFSFYENRQDGAVTLCVDCLQDSAGTSADHDPAGFDRYQICEVCSVDPDDGYYSFAIVVSGASSIADASGRMVFENEDDARAVAVAHCETENRRAARAAA